MHRLNASSLKVKKSFSRVSPEQLSKRSTRPNSATARLTTSSTADFFVTSNWSGRAPRPRARTSAASCSARLASSSATTQCAPSRANPKAMARAQGCCALVTKAILSRSLISKLRRPNHDSSLTASGPRCQHADADWRLPRSTERPIRQCGLECSEILLTAIPKATDVNPCYTVYSLNASSLVLLKEGSKTESMANSANASSVALIGRWMKTIGLPRDSNMARRRYSSINGPRI